MRSQSQVSRIRLHIGLYLRCRIYEPNSTVPSIHSQTAAIGDGVDDNVGKWTGLGAFGEMVCVEERCIILLCYCDGTIG